MSNFHRIQWIDTKIKSKNYPDISEISGKFEISRRQVYRDIEYMKDSLGAPIEYSKKNKGYIYSDDTFMLPSFFLGKEEKEALRFLSEQYSKIQDENSQNIVKLFRRMLGDGEITAEKNKFPVYSINKENIDIFNSLSEAIENKIKIKIDYLNIKFESAEREVSPYKIFNIGSKIYFVGYCHLKEDLRTFRIDRIKNIKLTNEKIYVCSYYFPERYKEKHIDFNYKIPYTATVLFEREFDKKLLKYRVSEINGKKYKIEFYNSSELVSNLMSVGIPFEIEKPLWLKNKIYSVIKNIFKGFGD